MLRSRAISRITNTAAGSAAGGRAADVVRRATRKTKTTPKRGNDPALQSIGKALEVIEGHMTTLVMERADAAERFEQRVAEDKAERRELFEKVDSIDTRLIQVEGKVERLPKIEKVVWRHEEVQQQAEGVKIFVGKVATVSKAVWALVGGAVVGLVTWLTGWPWK